MPRSAARKPVRLFSGVGHAIKKPKAKKSPKEKSPVVKPKPIRQVVKEKFDFSKTPYATPKRPRVELSEENSKKRKFFKTTVEAPQPKKPKLDTVVVTKDFDDFDDVEEDQINKNVSSFLKEWDFDNEGTESEMTRQEACELERESINSSLSYLTPKSRRESPIVCLTPITPNSVTPKTTMKNVLSDMTNKTKKATRSSLIKAAAPNDQYQIDAGQKAMGPKECAKCGMIYDMGDPVDEKRHNDFHTKRYELKYKTSKIENIVGFCGTDRIILIKHSDDRKRKTVEEILKITEEEIGSGYTFGPFSVAFIYVRNDRILGCLIAEPRVRASKILRNDGIVLLSNETRIVKCGVNRIWVKKEFRGKNIATEMMNCLRKNFGYGEYLKMEDIAFSSTTSEGHAFASKYTGRDDYLTYIELESRH